MACFDERAVADLKATGIFQPFEKEFFRKDGSRVPVLLGGAFFEGNQREGVAFIADLTDEKRAEDALRRQAGVRADVSVALTKAGQLERVFARMRGSDRQTSRRGLRSNLDAEQGRKHAGASG